MAFRQVFIKQAMLYKFRFFIGYILLFLALLVVLTVDIRTLPSGISLRGMETVVTSMNMGFQAPFDWILNAPFHALQKLSVTLFGLERLPIVLPSIVFGALTIVLFFLTMRQWFRESVAVITTLVAVTTGPFISMVRSATPDIMLPFFTVLLLLAAVKVLVKQERAFVWKIIVVLAALGLAYTPFGVYSLIAFIAGGSLHPHIRSRIRHIKTHRKIILISIGLIGLIPLVVYLVKYPSALAALTGQTYFRMSLDNFQETLRIIFVSFVDFTKSSFVGSYITPAFNIATLCLMLLGLFRCVQDRHTTRSYVILSWIVLTIPMALLAPSQQQIILVPALLLLAIGSETLVIDWYKLFPRNPYARTAGLVPLTILFVTIAATNITHYFYSQQYIGNPIYRNSLSAIRQTLDKSPEGQPLLLTDAPTEAFYSLLKREYASLSVTSAVPPTLTKKTMVTPETGASFGIPSSILTSAHSIDSVTLRVYTP